jgi:protein-disulfide isomerase
MLMNSSGAKSSGSIFAMLVLGASLAIVFGTSLPARPAQTQSKPASQTQSSAAAQTKVKAPSAQPQIKITEAQIAAAKTLGSKNAPIQFEVFSDFQCPMCRSFFLSAAHKLLEDYCSAGKVYLIHHDFPLPIPAHVHSEEAARWANAAAAIGKFHEVETALYTNQDSWGATGKIEEVVANVLSPADVKRVRALVESPEVRAAIQHDKDLGDSRGYNSTPTLLVTHNGHSDLLNPVGLTPGILKPYFEYLLQH